MSLGAQPSRNQRAKGRHRRPSTVQKAAQRAGMAAPVVVASGAMAVVPAFMVAAPHVAALAQTSPHTITTSPRTITAHLDAVVKPATPAARSYTVQPGDTLYGISQRYWGNGKYWPALYRANQSKISNPNLIYVGQVVTIQIGRAHV